MSVIDTPGLDFQEGKELKLERQVSAILRHVDSQYADTMSEASMKQAERVRRFPKSVCTSIRSRKSSVSKREINTSICKNYLSTSLLCFSSSEQLHLHG